MMNISKRLRSSFQLISPHANFLFISRVAWSIYALLELHKKEKKQKIAMPSFVCQSVVASAIAANWDVRFLDIEIDSGMVSSSEYAIAIDEGVEAILFVHLLGNKNNINNLQELCSQRGVLLIEDAAQYYTHSSPVEETNSAYVKLVSFGHSKIIDAGTGGLLFSDDESLVKEMEKFQESYVFCTKDSLEEVSTKFRKKFYEIKQIIPDNLDAKFEYKKLIKTYLPLLNTHVHFDEKIQQDIIDGINNLDQNIQRRKKNWSSYKEFLDFPNFIPLLNEDSIPWRASFRIEGISYKDQHKISQDLREKGYDVSNWYLPAHWYIDASDDMDIKMHNTCKLSKEVIQFWVDRDFDKEYFKNLRHYLIPHLI